MLSAPLDPGDALAATSAGSQVSARLVQRQISDSFPVHHWDRYEFLSLLGRGGMGAVYKARDRKLERIVALKFIRGDDEVLAQRFLQEAQAQARLDHPNLCRVFEVGQVDDKPYIAMQFIAGRSLDRIHNELTLYEKVELIHDAALAIHEAHRQGIIHRDIKPSNIMVERLPDGRVRPVVMDFGLARESTGNRGLTQTGAVMGTPSYMPPEQARGSTRFMDRRADVYSLGATLYELLTGEPPFVGEEVMDIIMAVLSDDPRPVRAKVPEIPVDLETIVLKCMAKEPAQRYDSARALAEDLRRYIDGDPIEGRRSSVVFRVRRRVRRNKAAYALGALALMVTVVLGGLGLRVELRARRQAEQARLQAALAQRLGQDIKEMELFMRAAYALPRHDIGREQAVVRRRMQQIATEQRGIASEADGALQYALGRGHLVLRDYPRAQAALEQAWKSGYRTPEARLGLGLVLGERYRQEVEQAQRAGDKNWIETRVRELENQYLKPALSYLEGASSNIEAPSYTQGLLALYHKQYAAALEAAARAQAEAPWLAEPLKLEGDVYQVLGIKLLDRGKYPEARDQLVRAVARHQSAAAISRSDSSIYEAEATDLIRILEIDQQSSAPMEETLKSALLACDHALEADPGSPSSYQLKAWAHWRSAYGKMMRSQDPEADIKQSIEMARRAIKLNTQDWQTHYYYSLALNTLAELATRRGEDAEPTRRLSISEVREALSRNQGFAWAWNDLGLMQTNQITSQVEHGVLDQRLFQDADNCFDQAVRIDPGYAIAYINRSWLHTKKIEFQIKHGATFDSEFSAVIDFDKKIKSINPNISFSYLNMSTAFLLKAEGLIASRKSAEAIQQSLSEAAKLHEQARALDRELIYLVENTAWLKYLISFHKYLAGEDPTPDIQEGLKTVLAGEKREPNNIDLALHKVRLYMLTGRYLGSSPAADLPFSQARAAAARAVALQPQLAAAQDVLCASFRHSAEALFHRKDLSPKQLALGADWIDRGLDACTAALAINPTLASAFGSRGALCLLRAHQVSEPAARHSAAAAAIESLTRALAINEGLRSEFAPLLESARALLPRAKL